MARPIITMPSHPPQRTELSWKKKLFFSGVVMVTFFGGIELTLMLAGVQPLSKTVDTSVGFSRQAPLFTSTVDENGKPILTTASNKTVWFNPQSFPAEKPQGRRRVFCLGGSTTYGRPFDDTTSYVNWIRQLLQQVDDRYEWEVINAGGISYGSFRVAALMEELSQFEPDLFIIYSAQNEFLERRTYRSHFEQPSLTLELSTALARTRIGSTIQRLRDSIQSPPSLPTPTDEELELDEVDEILNHSVGPVDYHRDPVWQREVIQSYRDNLRRMVQIARNCNAEIVFVTPASNLRDCSPFKSEFQQQSEADEAQLKTGKELLEDGEPQMALAVADELLSRDNVVASAHYLRGQSLFQLGESEQAEEAFQAAIDEDVCPLRAITPLVVVMEQVANETDTTLVDFRRLLRSKSILEKGHACFGDDYFLDHVHPNTAVHRDLGIWITNELISRGHVQGQSPAPSEIAVIQASIDEKTDIESFARALRNLAKVMHWSGKFREAAARAQECLELAPHDLESRFILADCLVNQGRSDEAYDVYQYLFANNDYPRAYLPYGELLMNRGEFELAESYLMESLVTDNVEHRARAYYDLGQIYSGRGDHQLAIQAFRRVDEIYPDDPSTLLWLSHSLQIEGDIDAAVETLRRMLRINPDDLEAAALLEELRGQTLAPISESVDREFKGEPTN